MGEARLYGLSSRGLFCSPELASGLSHRVSAGQHLAQPLEFIFGPRLPRQSVLSSATTLGTQLKITIGIEPRN